MQADPLRPRSLSSNIYTRRCLALADSVTLEIIFLRASSLTQRSFGRPEGKGLPVTVPLDISFQTFPRPSFLSLLAGPDTARRETKGCAALSQQSRRAQSGLKRSPASVFSPPVVFSRFSE